MKKEYLKCKELSLIPTLWVILFIATNLNGQTLSSILLEEIVVTATVRVQYL